MVTSAAWTDYDRDGRQDLVVVGEWMPVRVYHQERGRLVERTRELGLAGTEGWWNRVEVADLDGDGRQDLVLGNLGLNSYLRASAGEPARLYVRDFAKNGSLQQLLTFYKHGVSYPLAGRDEFVKLIPSLRSKYTSYAAFGARRIEDVLPATELASAELREARTFASAVAMNGARGFTMVPLPTEAQLAPVRATIAADFDGDGRVDLLLGGNFHGVPPMLGRYDASRGVLLRGLGGGRFEAVSGERSGLDVEGQVRKLAMIRGADGARLVVLARNGERLGVLRVVGGGEKEVASVMPQERRGEAASRVSESTRPRRGVDLARAEGRRRVGAP
jgi:enediyne biosynthesis protein E4